MVNNLGCHIQNCCLPESRIWNSSIIKIQTSMWPYTRRQASLFTTANIPLSTFLCVKAIYLHTTQFVVCKIITNNVCNLQTSYSLNITYVMKVVYSWGLVANPGVQTTPLPPSPRNSRLTSFNLILPKFVCVQLSLMPCEGVLPGVMSLVQV